MKNGFNFKEKLKEEALIAGFNLNNEMLSKLETYKDLLIEWNEKINLTSIIDEYQIIVKHFIDCLEITKYIKKTDKIIDVGTGAGFPGIVIAIFFESKIQITLLDSLNKRLLFLEEVRSKLSLENVLIVHGRAEDMAHKPEYRQVYDVAVARAVASLNVLTEYTSAYVKVGGKCIYLKGDNLPVELKDAEKALKILNLKVNNVYEYKLNLNENDTLEVFNRTIIEIVKTNNTPKNYPRAYGKIKKEQL